MGAVKEKKELIIKKLISLKVVLFIFFGGKYSRSNTLINSI